MAKSASEIANYQRSVLRKHWKPREPAKLRPDPSSKKSVLHTLEDWMRVFVHNVASPEEAVARFTDGCLDGVEVTVLAVPHHKNHAVFVKKPSGVVIIVTSKAPYEITGWFEAENIDDDFHKRGAGWLVKRSDPIFRHPKELLDEYHRA